MAETSSALADAPFSGDDLSRAEEFARESFVLPGEDAAQALAPGTARRAALEDAIKEIDSGREQPSIAWRRNYSLMLGLERLLSQEEPHLADGTTLNAHQVDALSGTLIALTSELQNGAQHQRARHRVTELPSSEVEIEGDELPDEEPLDWDPAEEAEEEAASEAAAEDPGAARRFWFEHATGAGKTVAAMGFVEASRTGGILILTHRRNLVDQFNGELRARGYRERVAAPLLKNGDGEPPAGGPGDGRDLPVVRAQRRQDLRRLHDRHLRRGAHRARREDQRRDPPVARAGVHRHDRDGRPDRAPRHRPVPRPRRRASTSPRRPAAA